MPCQGRATPDNGGGGGCGGVWYYNISNSISSLKETETPEKPTQGLIDRDGGSVTRTRN